jgi:hypothetical protein
LRLIKAEAHKSRGVFGVLGLMSLSGRVLPSGLFEYQEEAIRHSVKQLSSYEPVILALGTGLGKTLVIRETLIRLGVGTQIQTQSQSQSQSHPHQKSKRKTTALVICPSGLATQLSSGLRKVPAGCVSSSAAVVLDVKHADTGKQLKALLEENPDVLVVNWSLRQWEAKLLTDRDFLVIDEAHQILGTCLQRCKAALPHRGILYATASYKSLSWALLDTSEMTHSLRVGAGLPWQIAEARRILYEEAIFRVDKTPDLIESIGGALPRIVIRWLESSQSFPENLQNYFCMHEVDMQVRILASHYLQVDVTWNLPGSVWLYDAVSVTEDYAKILYKALVDTHSHRKTLLATLTTPPWVEPLPPATCHCLLAHYDSKKMIDQCFIDHPVVAPGVSVVKFTSNLSSAQRSKIIARLSKGKAVVAALRRASQASGNYFAKVLHIGNHWFLRELRSYIIPRLTILVTDRSIDLGYDLHTHIDSMMVNGIPERSSQLAQLLGRVSRASPGRIGCKDRVEVVLTAYRKTLDGFFLKQCGVDVSSEPKF